MDLLEIKNNLETWMTKLPEELKKVSIIDLAIPGSHNSATYTISRKSKIAPDAEPVIVALKFLGPILRSIVARWSKTQQDSISSQLKKGIRYFDFRLARKNEDFYNVHGLYGAKLEENLAEINDFIDNNPGEIVILDCQHFYKLNEDDHNALMLMLTSTFGDKLLEYNPNMNDITLENMTNQQKQIIVIYRSDAAQNDQPLLWPSNCFPTPWANTDSIPQLMTFLSQKLSFRSEKYAFISQCILTPSPNTIAKNVFSNLRDRLVIPAKEDKYVWIRGHKPGRKGGINIVIDDFIDEDSARFAQEVVALNWKLLE